MSELPVVVGDDVAAVGALAAERIATELVRLRGEGRAPVLGWPVGRTPRAVVAALAQRADVSMNDVHVVLMDEYARADTAVALDDPVSCRAAALRELVAPMATAGLDAARVHSPDPARPGDHERLIRDLGGIDLFLVALGASDGHVALNPPGTPVNSVTRVVRVADSTRADNVGTFGLDRLEQVPEFGVTVGLATITGARAVLVLAHGAGKRSVVQRLLAGRHFDPQLPASALRGHPNAVLVCDRACAPEGSR